MAAMNNRKAAIVGCGFVGSASAFALMESGLFSELVLIDANRDRAEGEALDISHGLPFAKPMKIYAGDYADIGDAEVVIVTAGANQRPAWIWSKRMSVYSAALFRKLRNTTKTASC